MGPVMIVLVAGAVSAFAAWLAKKGRRREEGESTAGQAISPPMLGRPRIDLKLFLFKWLGRFVRGLMPRTTEGARAKEGPQPHRASVSLVAASVINLLAIPFQVAGIVLLLWLVADMVLGYVVSISLHEAIRIKVAPVTAIAAPAVVGYWTNWLAVKMLFHPRRRNAVWHGLVPARRAELVEHIAEGTLKRLISPQIIRDYLHSNGMLRKVTDRLHESAFDTLRDGEFRKDLKDLVGQSVEAYVKDPRTRDAVNTHLRDKIGAWTGRRFTEKLLQWTKPLWTPMFLRFVEDMLPEIPGALNLAIDRLLDKIDRIPLLIRDEEERIESAIENAVESVLASIDMKAIVKNQLDRMDEGALEEMLTSDVSKEIRFIETSGGGLRGAGRQCDHFPRRSDWSYRPRCFPVGSLRSNSGARETIRAFSRTGEDHFAVNSGRFGAQSGEQVGACA